MFRKFTRFSACALLALAVAGVQGCKKKEAPKKKNVVVERKAEVKPGILIYSSQAKLWMLERGGQPRLLSDTTDWFPAINRAGTHLAYWEDHGNYLDLCVSNLATQQKTSIWRWENPPSLARNLHLHNAPCWDAGGEYIYYADGRQIWHVRADGSDLQTIYEQTDGRCFSVSVDAKGEQLVFVGINPDGAQNLWIFSLLSRECLPLTALTNMEGAVGAPVWSPKSNRVAYVVYRADQANVWIIDSTSEQTSVLTKDGQTNSPAWDDKGEKLAVSSGSADPYRWQISLISAVDGKHLERITDAPVGAFSPSICADW